MTEQRFTDAVFLLGCMSILDAPDSKITGVWEECFPNERVLTNTERREVLLMFAQNKAWCPFDQRQA